MAAARGPHVLAAGHVDVGLGLVAGVAEEGRQLRGLAQVLGRGPPFGIAQDHVGAGDPRA
jgi:hypothetical protein